MDWIACPACQLKHRRRVDSLCPRCHAPVEGGGLGGEGFGGGAVAAVAPLPAAPLPAAVVAGPVALAPPMETSGAPAWGVPVSGVPGAVAPARVDPDAPPLRLAGAAFLVNALLNVWVMGAAPRVAAEGALGTGTVVATLIDGFIGVSFLLGRGAVLDWARARVLLGALVFAGVHLFQKDYESLAAQVLLSAGLGLLLWGTTLGRRLAAGGALTAYLALAGSGLSLLTRGHAPLGMPVTQLLGRLERVPGNRVVGERFAYQVGLPSPAWRLRPSELARAENPLVDRWLVLPRHGVELLVVAEELPPNAQVDVAKVREVVMQGLQKGVKDLREVSDPTSPWPPGPDHVRATGTVNGVEVQLELRLVVHPSAFYQLIATGPTRGFTRAHHEVVSALGSFEARE